MQHLGELWIRVQKWAGPLISAGLFNIKHPGSWQKSHAEPANALTLWSELCLWILLPLGHTDFMGTCLDVGISRHVLGGSSGLLWRGETKEGMQSPSRAGVLTFKQHTKSIISELRKTRATRGSDFSLQAMCPFPGTSFSFTLSCWWCFFKLYPLHFCFPWSPCLSA